jgi:integrase
MTGSLVERPKGSGKWSAVLYLGADPVTGKKKQKWVRLQGNKRDAQRELRKLLTDMDQGTFVEPAKTTVAEFLESWLEAYCRLNLSAGTVEVYERVVRLHLIPQLGRIPLQKLSAMDLQRYFARAAADGRKDGPGGLAQKTLLGHYRILHKALNMAVKWQVVSRNIADSIDPPRAERKEMSAACEEESAAIIRAAEGTRMFAPVLLALCTGMRIGEILGLQWADVDLIAGSLTVRASLRPDRTLAPPKSDKSRRTITLPSLAVEALRRHKAEQAEQRLARGPEYAFRGFVLADETGTPYHPDTMSHAFVRMLAKHRLRRIRFHDLRHSHASQLLAQGINVKVVSERLGHSSASLTLDVYAHVLPNQQEEAARRVDSALRAAMGAVRIG